MNNNIDTNRRKFITGHWQMKPSISQDCLNYQGIYCQSCKDSCDVKAITFIPQKLGIEIPLLNEASCTACKACIDVCPINAINING